MRISLRGAAQVLLPPEDGLPYVRRAADMRLRPGSVTVENGVIAALDDDPGADLVIDAGGGAIVPGLVDCHTHLPFAGWRAGEYEQKVTGVPYEEISRRGGGIASSALALAAEADVDALDIYVESVAFRNEELERLGAIARREGVPLRAHVEQFNANRSVPVALTAGARSVDHLACLHPDDLAPLAAAECAAVLLPGAEFLGAENTAPGRALADAGAICVLGTDCNPGTSPVASLPLVIGLAVRRYGWTAREALTACTLNAAWVLGLHADRGSIEVGKRADLVVLDGPIERVPYRFGHNPVRSMIAGGEFIG